MHDASWMEAPLCLDHDRSAACGADYLLLSATTSSSRAALWRARRPERMGAARILLRVFVGDVAWRERAGYMDPAPAQASPGGDDQPAEQAVLACAGAQTRIDRISATRNGMDGRAYQRLSRPGDESRDPSEPRA